VSTRSGYVTHACTRSRAKDWRWNRLTLRFSGTCQGVSLAYSVCLGGYPAAVVIYGAVHCLLVRTVDMRLSSEAYLPKNAC
jgi:hypothetical protein